MNWGACQSLDTLGSACSPGVGSESGLSNIIPTRKLRFTPAANSQRCIIIVRIYCNAQFPGVGPQLWDARYLRLDLGWIAVFFDFMATDGAYRTNIERDTDAMARQTGWPGSMRKI
jgi:hypothetical protein